MNRTIDQNRLRGLFLVVVALFFGIQAVRYPIGMLDRPGAGLFPLIMSGLLLLLGLGVLVRSHFEDRVLLAFNPKNILIILASLCGFAVVSAFVNMIAGIVFLVFFSSLAASSRSLARSLKVSLGLIAVAFMFQKLLGLNLPLY